METQLNGTEPTVQTKPEQFNPEQLKLIKDEICPGASNNELQMFLYTCAKRNLDPLSKQIYSLPGYGKSKTRTTIIGIDGQRAVGHRSGLVAGVTDALFEIDDRLKSDINPEGLVSATVIIKKIIPNTQVIAEFTGTVFWREYAPLFNGKLGHMWAKMPKGQLGKCAESAAWRKSFPEELGGMYIREEMDQANVVHVPSQRVAPKKERKPVASSAAKKIIIEIKSMAADICKGKSKEDKLKFMKDFMNVTNFSDLAGKSEKDLGLIANKIAGHGLGEYFKREQPPVQSEPPPPTVEDLAKGFFEE